MLPTVVRDAAAPIDDIDVDVGDGEAGSASGAAGAEAREAGETRSRQMSLQRRRHPVPRRHEDGHRQGAEDLAREA